MPLDQGNFAKILLVACVGYACSRVGDCGILEHSLLTEVLAVYTASLCYSWVACLMPSLPLDLQCLARFGASSTVVCCEVCRLFLFGWHFVVWIALRIPHLPYLLGCVEKLAPHAIAHILAHTWLWILSNMLLSVFLIQTSNHCCQRLRH